MRPEWDNDGRRTEWKIPGVTPGVTIGLTGAHSYPLPPKIIQWIQDLQKKASGCGSGGRWFEPTQLYHLTSMPYRTCDAVEAGRFGALTTIR